MEGLEVQTADRLECNKKALRTKIEININFRKIYLFIILSYISNISFYSYLLRDTRQESFEN